MNIKKADLRENIQFVFIKRNDSLKIMEELP